MATEEFSHVLRQVRALQRRFPDWRACPASCICPPTSDQGLYRAAFPVLTVLVPSVLRSDLPAFPAQEHRPAHPGKRIERDVV